MKTPTESRKILRNEHVLSSYYEVDVYNEGNRLSGCIDGRELFSISFREGIPSWSSSTCMPSDMKLAQAYTVCINLLWEALENRNA